MKTYTFPVSGSFGDGDSWDGTFTIDLSDEEAERLEQSARMEPRNWMEEDPDLSDIMEKVRTASYEEDIQGMLKDQSFIQDQREKFDDSSASDREIVQRYLNNSSYDVMYPKELQRLTDD